MVPNRRWTNTAGLLGVEHLIGGQMGIFDEDESVNRAAGQGIDAQPLLFRIPVGVDDQAEEIILFQVVLDAAHYGRAERAEQVIHQDADGVGALGAQAASGEVGLISHFLSSSQDFLTRSGLDRIIGIGQHSGDGGD